MNNVLSLAYIGDAVYSVYIREYLINKGICKVDKLQKESVNYRRRLFGKRHNRHTEYYT